MSEFPVFKERKTKEKCLVRFWTDPNHYRRFVSEVEKQNLVIQDVFEDFIVWFAKKSQREEIVKVIK